MFQNTSKHFPVITHGPFMKYLGVGVSRADVMVTSSVLLAQRVCSRRGKLSLWYYVGVYLCNPKRRLPVGVQKFSHCFLGSKLLAQKLSDLEVFECTVVRRHFGSAHMFSLGFFGTDSMHTCPTCARHQERKQIKICLLPTFWINMAGY